MLGKFKVLSILLIVVGLVMVPTGNALTQDTPTLGTAASFGVLGGSTVTNTGDTQTVIAATQTAAAPTLTAIAMTPTPTNTLAPLALEKGEQPQRPVRFYLPLTGH